MAITRPPTTGDLSLAGGHDGQSHKTSHTEIPDAIERIERTRVDVTHPDYGAVLNGSTDDTVAINAAITAVAAVGGGTVVIPYTSTGGRAAGIVGASRVRLVGQNNVTLKAPNGATSDIISGTNVDGFRVEGFTLDLNALNIRGVKFTSSTTAGVTDCKVSHVRVINPGYVEGVFFVTSDSLLTHPLEIEFRRCKATGVKTAASFAFYSLRGSRIRYVHCGMLDCEGWGIVDERSVGTLIEGCKARRIGKTAYVIQGESAVGGETNTQWRVVGNHAEDCGRSGYIQTIDLGDFATGDTFKLTYNAAESSLLTYAADIAANIQSALAALAGIGAGNVTVTRTSSTVYVADFRILAPATVNLLSITTVTGFTPTGVTRGFG